MRFSYPLRITVPLVLLVFTVIAGAFSFITAIGDRDRQVENTALTDVRMRMTHLQGTVERLLRQRDLDGVQEEISILSDIEAIESVFLADENSRIIAATSLASVGRSADPVLSQLPADIEKLRRSQMGSVELGSDRNSVVALYPILFSREKERIRPFRIGVLFMRYGITEMKKRARRDVMQTVLLDTVFFAGLVVLLWFYFSYAVTRRAELVVRAAERFSQGELSARAGIQGEDELGMIGKSFDRMAERIGEDSLRLAHYREHLEELVKDRTEDLESFAYSVSHDLRGPLRAIDGFSGILSEEYAAKLDDEGKRLLGVVRANTQKMGQLIDDILSFSRMGRKEILPSWIDMESLARDVFNELRPVERELRFVLQPLPPVSGDPSMIRQVWVNLVSNALKFSSGRPLPEIEIGGRTEGDQTIYFVRDNGVGFDMRYVHKLFGVFQRLHTEDEFKGTGIGLAIVKRIVGRHKGKVWAEGAPGKGATIYFQLPRGEA